MTICERDTIRDLTAIECDQVSGGIVFHPEPGPVSPEPPIPPIIFQGPLKPTPGPIPYPGPNPGPFLGG
jgi:hypothetical protein